MKFDIIQEYGESADDPGAFDVYADGERIIEGYAYINGLPCVIEGVEMEPNQVPDLTLDTYGTECVLPLFMVLEEEYRSPCIDYYQKGGGSLTVRAPRETFDAWKRSTT